MSWGGPGSLLRRLGALALGVTLLSLALHVGVVAIGLHPLSAQLAQQVAARSQLTRSLLLTTAAPEREALAHSLRQKDFELLKLPGPTPRGTITLPGPIGPVLIEALGPGFEVSLFEPKPLSFEPVEIRIDTQVQGEHWRIRLFAQPPVNAMLGTAIGWMLLAALSVGASLLLGLRLIVQPMGEVVRRITEQGATLQPLQVPQSASSEVKRLVDSFNRLAERVLHAQHARQQLLAGVSHDLRTPLARLRLRIETQCSPEVADAAQAELGAVEHIVAQFLAYVQGNTGTASGRPASAVELLRSAVQGCAERGQPVALELLAPDALVPSVGLQRVLTNLLDNAQAYGRAPFTLAWSVDPLGQHQITVWDHGPGLSPGQFAQAREPFVRLSTDADIGHCGLGLAIVAQIAQRWGGQLHCGHDSVDRFGVWVVWPPAAAPSANPELAPGEGSVPIRR